MRVEVACFLVALTAASCPTFSCSNLPAGECISVAGNATLTEVGVAACGNYMTCPVVQQGTSNCVADVVPLSYPGDFCGSNSECGKNTCLPTGVCSGVAQGGNCTAVYDCNPGLACDVRTLTCEPQGVEGAACIQTFDCGNNLICSLGFCIPYFSTPIDYPTDVVENVQMGLALACTSGFAVQDNEIWMCTTAPVSTGELPVSCTPGAPGQCPDSLGIYSSACLCGYNSAGSGYCSLFPGDLPAQYMMGNMTILTEFNSDCNTYSRFSFNCFAKEELRGYLDEYYAYALNFALLTDNAYPLTVANPPCVKSVFTSQFWELSSALENYQDNLCPRYFCTNSTAGWQPNQCIMYQNQTYQYMNLDLMLLNPCPSNATQCNPTTLHNSTCTPVKGMAFPGDFCQQNADCVTNQCSNSTCIGGLSPGSTCYNAYDCNPGYFCSFTTLTCTQQVGVGAPCNSDFDCRNYMGCNLGKCVEYFSLKNGATTDSMLSTGYAELCASGYANITVMDPLSGVCADAPASPSAGPIRCIPGNACLSINGTSEKPCTCGYNSAGASYCPLFEGDSPMVLARYNFQYLMDYNLNCNTYSRKSELCFKQSPESLQYYYYYALNLTYFNLYPRIVGSEDCALNIYAAEYVTLQQHQANNPYHPTPINPDNSTAYSLLPPALFSLLPALLS